MAQAVAAEIDFAVPVFTALANSLEELISRLKTQTKVSAECIRRLEHSSRLLDDMQQKDNAAEDDLRSAVLKLQTTLSMAMQDLDAALTAFLEKSVLCRLLKSPKKLEDKAEALVAVTESVFRQFMIIHGVVSTEFHRQQGVAMHGILANPCSEPPYPDDEDERLASLRQLPVEELVASGCFNMYCEVAANTMKCPIAFVSLLAEEKLILLANIGLAQSTMPRKMSFCAYTICQQGLFVVLDTKADPRFRENSKIKNNRGKSVKVRFYAGVTISSKTGHALGTIAVLDTKPRRECDEDHIGMLLHLGFLAEEKLSNSIQHKGKARTRCFEGRRTIA